MKLGEITAGWRSGRQLRLMFQEEASRGRKSRSWLVPPPSPATRQRHADAATHLRPWRGEPSGLLRRSLVLPHVNTECTQFFLDEIARCHPEDDVVMVVDGALWHKS